jgi:hypothetical protein
MLQSRSRSRSAKSDSRLQSRKRLSSSVTETPDTPGPGQWLHNVPRSCCSPEYFTLPRCAHKIPFHVRVSLARNGLARHQDHFHRLHEIVLMPAEHLAQKTPRPRTNHRAADFSRSHDTDAGNIGPSFSGSPVEYQAAFNHPLAFAAHPVKLPTSFKPLLLREWKPSSGWSLARHGRFKPGSGACGQSGGDWKEWPGRIWWNCG